MSRVLYCPARATNLLPIPLSGFMPLHRGSRTYLHHSTFRKVLVTVNTRRAKHPHADWSSPCLRRGCSDLQLA